jgi:hypothetical protein
MKISSNILTELKELSPLLAGMERVNVFTTPVGYFDNICATVLLAVEKEKGLPALSGQSTFDIPAGYFDSLAGNILAKIKDVELTQSEELKGLSPMLYSIQNENVYKVPTGYFDGLADSIIKQIQPEQAKIVPMRKRSNIFKYAIAASVAGIMAIGIYTIENNKSMTGSNNLYASLDPAIQKGQSMGEAQFTAILDSLSTQEIANYLEKHNDEADVATLTSSLDANNLPNQEDYIVDDKTLDNYLEDLHSSSSKN